MKPLAALCLSLFALTSCMTNNHGIDPGRGHLAHTVYFWFSDNAPEDAADQLLDFYRTEVPNVPGIEVLFAGKPRPNDEREVVDSSYDLGVITVYESSDAEQVWQEHPIHDVLKERFLPMLDKVQVYDTVE